jgi:hypothetical protein
MSLARGWSAIGRRQTGRGSRRQHIDPIPIPISRRARYAHHGEDPYVGQELA